MPTPLLSVRDAIAAGLAELSRLVTPPTEPLGYGVDLVVVSDVDPRWSEEDPESPFGIVHATIRRITCRRGQLPGIEDDERDYGIDLRDYLNRPSTEVQLRALEGASKLEIEKDDRIESATVALTLADNLRSMTLEISITPVDPTLGGFNAVVSVSSAGAVLGAISGG